ncbi:hypothetical protein [Alienimonas sp. DA493]|uniref:hypothetical protein n=1 Tax=Alienimonas sp. DA493 TaxID=3373605 RepID=UPI0037553D88
MQFELLIPTTVAYKNPEFSVEKMRKAEADGNDYKTPVSIKKECKPGFVFEPLKVDRKGLPLLVHDGILRPKDDEAWEACGIDPSDDEAKRKVLKHAKEVKNPLLAIAGGNATGDPAKDRAGALAGRTKDELRAIGNEHGVHLPAQMTKDKMLGRLLSAGVPTDAEPPEADDDASDEDE